MNDGVEYTCPMHPEVRQMGPGACPKCGMAVEPVQPQAPAAGKTEYTCPMHPQIVRDEPGACPICGKALKPQTVTLEAQGEDPELRSMKRRFWVILILTAPLLVIAMDHMVPGLHWVGNIPPRLQPWRALRPSDATPPPLIRPAPSEYNP